MLGLLWDGDAGKQFLEYNFPLYFIGNAGNVSQCLYGHVKDMRA